jgi:3-phenylpropionate/cinnamic acid dioxygenase small subunit
VARSIVRRESRSSSSFRTSCVSSTTTSTTHGFIYDDKAALLRRVRRLGLGRAVQEVRSRVGHSFSNLLVLEETDEEVTVRVVMVVYEVQRSRKNYYPGHCVYRLRRTDCGFRIALKKLWLIDNDQFYENLAFMI